MAAETETQTDAPQADAATMRALTAEIARLNNHRFVRIHNSTKRLMWFQFLRGLSFGLGSVMGATILVTFVGFWLSQIEFIPIIGDWATQIADEIGYQLNDPENVQGVRANDDGSLSP